MQQTQADPLVDALVRDFGGNYAFALDLLEQYRRDPQAVDASWRQYFDRVTGAVPANPKPVPAATVTAAPTAATDPAAAGWSRGTAAAAAGAPAARPGSLVRQDAAPALARERSKALVVPAILPGDIAQPIRGGALRVVENMEASLQVPTATSMRSIPVRT